MKNSKRLTAIMTTAIIISLMASSLTMSAAFIENLNPDTGKTTLSSDASYMDASSSAYAASAKYGDLLNPEYEWGEFLGNTPERTAFNPGPAPDKPNVLWTSRDVSGFGTPLNAGHVAFAGKLIQSVTKTLANGTSRPHLAAFDPFTGQTIWATPLPAGQSFYAAFGATCLHKVDDNHVLALTGQGFAMFRVSDGALLWRDPTMNPDAAYHRSLFVNDPEYGIKMLFGPQRDLPDVYLVDRGWDLSDPEVDKGAGNRLAWQFVRDEVGRVQLCYGQGLIFMGSYGPCKVYARNATTGEKVWRTSRHDAAGYSGSYADGKLVVGCESQYITCYNATNGEILWENPEGLANRAFNVWNGIIAYGRTYWHDLGTLESGATKCLDLETGAELWRARTDMQIGYYQFVAADGKIYGRQSDSSTTTGRVPTPTRFSCWDAFTGAELWSLNVDPAWPIIAYGCLFFTAGGTTYCISTAKASEDWTMFRGSVENPGFSYSLGPVNIRDGPKWTFTTGSEIGSSPVVAQGKLYINSGDLYVYCIDAYNGSLIWRFKTKHEDRASFDSTPAVIGDKVIIGPDDGNLYILDADTGEMIHKVPMGNYVSAQFDRMHPIRSSPIIYKNRIYVGSLNDNKTYCVDLNGNVVWSYQTGGPIVGSAAISNDTVYIATKGSSATPWNDVNSLYMFTLDGVKIKNFALRSSESVAEFTPVVVKDILYIGTPDNRFLAYNTTNGAEIMRVLLPNILSERTHGSVIYVPGYRATMRNATNGTTYGTSVDKVITPAGPTYACVRADIGTPIWSTWAGWMTWSSPVMAGIGNEAVIYQGSESYGMTVMNASTGTAISWYTAGGGLTGSPAVWDGKLYFGSHDNNVYCFEDHSKQQMATSISVDKTTVDLNNTESVTVTTQLTGETNPDLQFYEPPWVGPGAYKGSPPFPNATVKVTFTDPDMVEHTLTAVTDNMGWASWTFTPNKAGTWKIMTWYEGQGKPAITYDYAFSDQVPIEAAYTITEPEKPTEPTGTNIPMEYVYAAIAVIVIVIVAAAALMLLRRRKK